MRNLSGRLRCLSTSYGPVCPISAERNVLRSCYGRCVSGPAALGSTCKYGLPPRAPDLTRDLYTRRRCLWAWWRTSRVKVRYMSVMDVDASGAAWRKSLRSVGNGACVEVAPVNGSIVVRDTVDRSGPVVQYSTQMWRAFVADAKAGAFDVFR
ncbi:MAG TPA: DUF397 domain-containing protein [Streptosporangiaceae bacterium]|nr:DUF397 domain-containing protein [Streptosporangiaceae bacterium]